jgi:hypothetical protein
MYRFPALSANSGTSWHRQLLMELKREAQMVDYSVYLLKAQECLEKASRPDISDRQRQNFKWLANKWIELANHAGFQSEAPSGEAMSKDRRTLH